MADSFQRNVLPVGNNIAPQARIVINNVLSFLMEIKEDPEKNKNINFSRPRQLTAEMCNVSLRTVDAIKQECKDGVPKVPRETICQPLSVTALDDFDKSVIKQVVTSFYAEGEYPTLSKIVCRAKERIDGFKCSVSSMRTILSNLGYKYKMAPDGRKQLMERRDIVCARLQFLRKLKSLKDSEDVRPRVYLDETWVNQNHSRKRVWVDKDDEGGLNNNKTGKGSRLIVPTGRTAALSDVLIRHYGTNSTIPTSYRFREVKRLLEDPNFDLQKPTVIYAHGYVELASDASVTRVVKAYLQLGGYNVLVLDWANLGFGAYFAVAWDLKPMAVELGRALSILLKRGLSLEGLHLIGHSMGAHLVAFAARELDTRGYRVPRLTGLDAAYPGFYPSLLSVPMSPDDAEFVDAIHTDGGAFGAPDRTAHADFWPNEGHAKQPGCVSATVPFTVEDFCSHWRSWEFWAESVTGGEFLARSCEDYDTFLRGQCKDADTVYMGLRAKPTLRGNYYLRTAAKAPYALGERGAD